MGITLVDEIVAFGAEMVVLQFHSWSHSLLGDKQQCKLTTLRLL
jgi:hypothetical protein